MKGEVSKKMAWANARPMIGLKKGSSMVKEAIMSMNKPFISFNNLGVPIFDWNKTLL